MTDPEVEAQRARIMDLLSKIGEVNEQRKAIGERQDRALDDLEANINELDALTAERNRRAGQELEALSDEAEQRAYYEAEVGPDYEGLKFDDTMIQEATPTIQSLQAEVNALRRQLYTARILWIVQGGVLILMLFNWQR